MQKFDYRFSGDRVSLWMGRRGLDLSGLARLVDMTTVQVAAILGGIKPNTSTLERLADAMQVHPGKFFTRGARNHGGESSGSVGSPNG